MKQNSKWFAFSVLIGLSFFSIREATAKESFSFKKNDQVVIIGNTFGERLTTSGYFETYLQLVIPDRQVTLRSLCWPADELSRVEELKTKAMEASGEPHSSGKTVLFQPRPQNFGDMFTHLKQQNPDVLVLCFGMTESFNGPAGVEKFQRDLSSLVADARKQLGDKKQPLRIIAVSPIAHEDLGGELPDPKEHNKNLERYTAAIETVCKKEKISFIDLFHPTLKKFSGSNSIGSNSHFTINGIHLNAQGNQLAAKIMVEELGYSTKKSSEGPLFEKLRQEVVKKNQLFYYRYRAVNGEYIYGRRKDPFGTVNFPEEMKKLDRLAAESDAKIHALARD